MVIKNFGPGRLDDLEAGFEKMRRSNGKIIVSTTRFGQCIPYSMDDDDELLSLTRQKIIVVKINPSV